MKIKLYKSRNPGGAPTTGRLRATDAELAFLQNNAHALAHRFALDVRKIKEDTSERSLEFEVEIVGLKY